MPGDSGLSDEWLRTDLAVSTARNNRHNISSLQKRWFYGIQAPDSSSGAVELGSAVLAHRQLTVITAIDRAVGGDSDGGAMGSADQHARREVAPPLLL